MNSPSATLPEITSTRYSPPGRGSSAAAWPIQRVAFSGCTRNSHTVSGLASIWISRLTAVSVLASILLPFLEFGLSLERLEPLVPELLEELPDRLEALRADPVEAPRAVAPLVHEPRLLQDGQVLRHSRPGDVEVRRDLARGELVVTDERQDQAAVRRCDRLQGGFHGPVCKQILTLGSTNVGWERLALRGGSDRAIPQVGMRSGKRTAHPPPRGPGPFLNASRYTPGPG